MAGFGDVTFLAALRRLGPGLAMEAARAILLGRCRSLAEDARRVMARIDRPVRVEGRQLVPPHDPFVLVANHFQAPGLWIGWVAAAITASLAEARAPGRRELHWMVLSEWRWFEVAGRWVPNPITSLLFPRACRVWGLIPTPSRPSDVPGRARSLRLVLTYLGRRPGAAGAAEPVGLFPEGTATVALQEARPGTGAFLHRISRLGVPLLPVGVHQDEGVLVVRFGAPFLLGNPPMGQQADLDGWARERVMVAIGRLLPPALWGVYSDAIAEAGEARR